jgi:hypothetical protein
MIAIETGMEQAPCLRERTTIECAPKERHKRCGAHPGANCYIRILQLSIFAYKSFKLQYVTVLLISFFIKAANTMPEASRSIPQKMRHLAVVTRQVFGILTPKNAPNMGKI